jgi:hypothetical protein
MQKSVRRLSATPGRLDMQRVRRLLQQPGFHILAFLLFLFVMVWPVLSIPGKGPLPSFFVYLFSIWGLMILSLFLMSRHSIADKSDEGEDKQQQGGTRRV